MSEQESVSERELAEQLRNELFSGEPRSVGEALAAAEEAPEPPVETPPEPPATPPVVVTDTPEQPEPQADAPTEPADELGEPTDEPTEVEEPEEGEEDDPNVVWAKKRYGDDTAKWAKGAREQDQHISRLTNEKKEAEQLAVQWYEYAQQAEAAAQSAQTQGMPMSAAEEAWVEQAMANPYQYARQAAMNGNVNLFNAVLARVAEENPGVAASIGTQVQMEMAQYVAAQDNGQQQAAPPLDQTLGASFARLGIDLAEAGPSMMEKVAEMGEYHPYVQAILNGDDAQRDLAVQAVYDLVREGQFTKRRVREDDREATIRREAELRREAAGVVTGSPHTPPPPTSGLLDAMEAEWRARGQWSEE
jgi:hypothetical protein